MPEVDLADDTFVVAPAEELAARLAGLAFWRTCWPAIELSPYHDRGAEGMRWYAGGALSGTAELWLEPYRDGTVVHVFLRADPARGTSPPRRLARLRRDYAVSLKTALFALKDEMESGRAVGTSRIPIPARPSTRGPDELHIPAATGAEAPAEVHTEVTTEVRIDERPDAAGAAPDTGRAAKTAQVAEAGQDRDSAATRRSATRPA
ncbi:hypothetical protein [Actinopolymorpha pittospori]|uniref:Polyketide cyclase / dehydrase and lipid transport n=1 Tax=Actinopolymorpha pittospori TaxID=648752 RepID=A0A927N237_9ACTN|nr:hypothetical protein [Actinopolymorpha pittospori]MBE1610901.1 hypothetical protein [Actinopolymorpha pittospori]